MTKSTVPIASLTLKSATAIPSLTPGPSLSLIVPIPRSSSIGTSGLLMFESLISRSSLGSSSASSTTEMVTSCVAPETVPAGKVTEGPPVSTV